MRSHHSTWSSARAHGVSLSVREITNWKILLNIQRKEKLYRKAKKLKLTRKSSFDVLFCLFYFSIEKYLHQIQL